MMLRHLALLSVVAALIAFPHNALAQSSGTFTYTGFDVPLPNVSDTRPTDLNNKGDVVGRYHDSAGTPHGFLRSANGTFTAPINFPGATDGTAVRGNNSNGDLVGKFFDNTGQHAFLMSLSRNLTFDVPAAFGTAAGTSEAYGINDFGEIVGDYSVRTQVPGYGQVLVTHGFLRNTDGT